MPADLFYPTTLTCAMSRLTITTVITKTYTHSSSACGRVGARVKISHHGNQALYLGREALRSALSCRYINTIGHRDSEV